jgi:hypothetical protein
MDIDNSDNIYVVGICGGTVDGNINKGSSDMCFAKYDSNGNKQFSGQIGGTGNDRAYGIAVNNLSRTFYIVGPADSMVLDNMLKISIVDQVWIQYDCLTGAKLLSNHYGVDNSGQTVPQAVTVDSTGNVIIVGYSSKNWMGIPNRGMFDIFTLKLSPTDGNIFARLEGGNNDDYGNAVATDPNDNIYTLGVTLSTAVDGQVNNGITDNIIIKYSPTGQKLFSVLVGGELWEQASGIAVDPSTNSLIAVGLTSSLNLYGLSAKDRCSLLMILDMTTGARKHLQVYCSGGTVGLAEMFAVDVRDRRIAVAGYATADGVSYFGFPIAGQDDGFLQVIETPTSSPTTAPTMLPTTKPTITPSFAPTRVPTNNPTSSTSSAPTIAPTPAPTSPATWGQLNCPGFYTANTNFAQQNTIPCHVIACQGRTVRVSMCSSNTNNGASCSGDTFLRVMNSSGLQVASNDNSCGTCSSVTFTASTGCTRYSILQGCAGSGACSGVSAVTFLM